MAGVITPPTHPGGSSLQIQYNNANVFGGAAGSSWDAAKQALAFTALSGGGTNATKTTAMTITQGQAAFDVGLSIVMDGSGYSGLDIVNLNTSGGRQLARFWTNIGGTLECPTYISASGALFTRTGVFVSGKFTPSTPGGTPGDAQQIVLPSADAAMMAVYADVYGPCFQFRTPACDVTGAHFLSGLSGSADYTFQLDADGTLIFGAWTGYGGTSTRSLMDTRFGRGEAAATISLGGGDVYAPSAQTLTAQSVMAPVSLTTAAASAEGTNTIYFNSSSPGPTSLPWLPPKIVVGLTITNSTHPTSIPAGATISAIDATRRTITLNQNIAAPGVSSGDLIVFQVADTAGIDLTIAGSKGTGTGAGGSLKFKVAPAGTTGSTQNALADALVIDSTKLATFSAGVIASNYNKVTVTQPATASTLTIANGKTLTANATITLAGVDSKTLTLDNSLTLAGTDGTTMTFPAVSATVAGLGVAQTWTAENTHSQPITLDNSVQIKAKKLDGTALSIMYSDTNNQFQIGTGAWTGIQFGSAANTSHMMFVPGTNTQLRFMNAANNDHIMCILEASRQIAFGSNTFDGCFTFYDDTATTGDTYLNIRSGAARAARLRFGTGGTYDVGLSREAAGLLVIQDASTTLTNYRDIKLRDVYSGANKVVTARQTGWGAPTGTLTRTALAAYAGQTVTATYVQAEAQATDNAVKACSQALAALITDLTTHGLIGA